MSISFKLKGFLSLLLFLFALSTAVAAGEDYYTTDSSFAIQPYYVDSLLKAAPNSYYLDSTTKNFSAERILPTPDWDIQHLKKPQHVNAIYWGTLIILLLLGLIKLGYQNFFYSSLSSIANSKVFQLYFRTKKLAGFIPLFFFFLIKILTLSLLSMKLASLFTGNSIFVSARFFAFSSGLICGFYMLRYFMEYVVNLILGTSQIFRQYLVEYTLITTWLWLLIVPVILVFSGAFSDVNKQTVPLFFMIILFAGSGYAHLRSMAITGTKNIAFFLHFFIYFCTFKILPYLVIAKWLSNHWTVFS